MNFKTIILWTMLLPTYALGLEIYPQVSGTITSIKSVGDVVNKGDLLAQIDNRQAKLDIKHLEVLQSVKQQVFDDKKLELQQTQELYDRMVSSLRDLDLAKMAFDKAKRELDAHNLKIEIAKIELEKYTIKSPVSGTVKALPNSRNVVSKHAPKVLMIIE